MRWWPFKRKTKVEPEPKRWEPPPGWYYMAGPFAPTEPFYRNYPWIVMMRPEWRMAEMIRPETIPPYFNAYNIWWRPCEPNDFVGFRA